MPYEKHTRPRWTQPLPLLVPWSGQMSTAGHRLLGHTGIQSELVQSNDLK